MHEILREMEGEKGICVERSMEEALASLSPKGGADGPQGCCCPRGLLFGSTGTAKLR